MRITISSRFIIAITIVAVIVNCADSWMHSVYSNSLHIACLRDLLEIDKAHYPLESWTDSKLWRVFKEMDPRFGNGRTEFCLNLRAASGDSAGTQTFSYSSSHETHSDSEDQMMSKRTGSQVIVALEQMEMGEYQEAVLSFQKAVSDGAFLPFWSMYEWYERALIRTEQLSADWTSDQLFYSFQGDSNRCFVVASGGVNWSLPVKVMIVEDCECTDVCRDSLQVEFASSELAVTLLANGGFEWELQADHLSDRSTDIQGFDTNLYHLGRTGVQIVDSTMGNAMLLDNSEDRVQSGVRTDNLPLIPGQHYILGAQAMVSGAGYVNLNCWVESRTVVQLQILKFIPSNEGIYEARLFSEFAVPPLAEQCYLSILNYNHTGDVIVDNLILVSYGH